ncbi:hypothetical protein FO519_004689 [Halicephalobus sp. NKZ332]|nr:hypothetical protein FO519_004689 [Halicephalobus sp. NKZ332]
MIKVKALFSFCTKGFILPRRIHSGRIEAKMPSECMKISSEGRNNGNLSLEEFTKKLEDCNLNEKRSLNVEEDENFASLKEAAELMEKCRIGEENQNFIPKRADYITWDEMHMGLALLTAKRSKDPHTQVGAVIVDDDNVLCGIGYNGLPRGCSDDLFPWGKDKEVPFLNKYSYVSHAEANAILNCMLSPRLKGTRIYTTLFPCNDCSKMLVQVGIKEVIFHKYKSDSHQSLSSKVLLHHGGVKIRQFKSERKSITLDFD